MILWNLHTKTGVSSAHLNISNEEELQKWVESSSSYLRKRDFISKLKQLQVSFILCKEKVDDELLQLCEENNIILIQV